MIIAMIRTVAGISIPTAIAITAMAMAHAQTQSSYKPERSLEKDAENGDGMSQMILCANYWGRNDVKALKWCTKAAEQRKSLSELGFPPFGPELPLSIIYYQGQVTKKDDVKARMWALKAAERARESSAPASRTSTALAENFLGFMYANGIGGPQDYTEARSWLLKAVNDGSKEANAQLGVLYYFGRGVQKDDATAFQWLLKAARQDLPEAQRIVGLMYAEGLGVTQNSTEARSWLQKAVQQGNTEAKQDLKMMETASASVTGSSRGACLSSCRGSSALCSSGNNTSSFLGFSAFGFTAKGFVAGQMLSSDCGAEERACMRRCAN